MVKSSTKPDAWTLSPQMTATPELWRGCVACFPLWEGVGRVVSDISGHNNNASESSAGSSWILGPDGRRVLFSTSGFLVDNPKDALLGAPTTDVFTINFWFETQADDAGNAAFSWSGTDDLIIYPNNNGGGVRVFWRDKGSNIINVGGDNLIGETHMQTLLSRGSGDIEAFLDANSQATSSATGTSNGFNSVYIGTFDDSQFYDGDIGLVTVWKRALENHELKCLFDDPFAMLRPAGF